MQIFTKENRILIRIVNCDIPKSRQNHWYSINCITQTMYPNKILKIMHLGYSRMNFATFKVFFDWNILENVVTLNIVSKEKKVRKIHRSYSVIEQNKVHLAIEEIRKKFLWKCSNGICSSKRNEITVEHSESIWLDSMWSFQNVYHVFQIFFIK